MRQIAPSSRTGSVYHVTLITVGAIVSMVFIGLNMRLLLNSQTDMVTEMSTQSTGVFDAAELAIEHIATDVKWKDTAKSGIVFDELTLNDATYRGTVTDADTATIPDADTTNYRVRIEAESGISWSGARFDIERIEVNYTKIVEDMGAISYWPLNEPLKTLPVADLVGGNMGAHRDIDVPGAGTNDEGALVPVFADASDHIEVPFNSRFEQNNASMTFWLKMTEDESITSVLGMQKSQWSYPTINVSIWNMGLVVYMCEHGGLDITKFLLTPTEIIKLNTWHHIAVTWGSRGLRVYLDGTQVAYNTSNTSGLESASAISGGEQPFHFGGGFKVPQRSMDEEGFNGSLAHVVYFDPVLDADEIQELADIRPDFSSFELVEDSWVRVFNDD